MTFVPHLVVNYLELFYLDAHVFLILVGVPPQESTQRITLYWIFEELQPSSLPPSLTGIKYQTGRLLCGSKKWTIQTWVNGAEVILKKVGREYSHRFANEPGDWTQGFPDGMVWADAQALFKDSL